MNNSFALDQSGTNSLLLSFRILLQFNQLGNEDEAERNGRGEDNES